MAEKFYTILTNIGKAQIANSGVMGSKVNFVKFKIGDGGGSYYEPTENQKDLVHTVYEGNITDIETDKTNPNWMKINLMIPANVGGFMIREYGVFDEKGNMLAVAKCAESYKPIAEDGSTKELILRMILAVSNTKSVNMELDPTLVFVTKEELEQLRTDIEAQLKDIANKVDNIKIADGTTTTKGIVKLNNATNSTSQTEAATPLAVKTAMDKANEAFTSASNGKSYIAGKVGNVSGNNTFTQIGDRVQIDKNDFATQLNAKNVSASGNEALASLVSKIAQISVQGMGGKRFTCGTITTRLPAVSYESVNLSTGGIIGNFLCGELSLSIPFNASIIIAWAIIRDQQFVYTTIVGNNCTSIYNESGTNYDRVEVLRYKGGNKVPFRTTANITDGQYTYQYYAIE